MKAAAHVHQQSQFAEVGSLFAQLQQSRPFCTICLRESLLGLVALPLAMAFGIASGVSPQAGLYTAVVAGFLISALGGSRTQIGGPTGAFVVIVAGIVARFGMSGLAMVTLMAGIILLAMGLTGLGSAVRFIPRPVVIGFTNGIAVLIASTQIKDFFGLRVGAVPSEFLPRMKLLIAHLPGFNWQALVLGAVTLAILLILPRITKRVPASIVALLACTAACAFLHLPVETIGSRFGGIPRGLPPFAIPDFHAEHILPLIPSAFTVALLAALESMLSAVVADSMTGDRHNPNVELVAQGIANITSPLFGGIPATGAIARTATNIRSGARSPVSGMVHALTLLAILLVAAPLASYIPACDACRRALRCCVQHGRVEAKSAASSNSASRQSPSGWSLSRSPSSPISRSPSALEWRSPRWSTSTALPKPPPSLR